MSLFVYNWHNLVVLDENIFKVIKLYSYSIHVLETQKEGCVYKNNMECDSAQRNRYSHNAFNCSSAFAKSDFVVSGHQCVELNDRVSFL